MTNLQITYGINLYYVYVLCIVTLGPFLFGYHMAELNAPLNTLKCRKDDITNNSLSGLPHCFPLSPSQIGLITSAFTIGGLLSAVVAGPVSDRRGRLQPMKAAALLFIIGSILESLSSHFIILVCGRFISGLAAGVSVVVVPMFISETAPAISSGFCGSLTQVTVNFGIFATQLIGHFLSYGRLWRVVLVLPSLVGLAQIVGLFTITESPVWAIRQGDFGTASTIQRRIRPKDFDLNTEMKIWRSTLYPEANDEFPALLAQENQAQEEAEPLRSQPKNDKVGLVQIFSKVEFRTVTWIVTLVMVAQQFCGINSIIMYGVPLLADMLHANSGLLAVIVSVVNIVTTLASATIMDRVGRKQCLIASVAGMGLTSILIGAGIQHSIVALTVMSVLGFVASFAIGLGPIPFMTPTELALPHAIGATQSWALAVNWTSTYLVAQFFPIINSLLGKGIVFYLFSLLAVLFGVALSFSFPDGTGIH